MVKYIYVFAIAFLVSYMSTSVGQESSTSGILSPSLRMVSNSEGHTIIIDVMPTVVGATDGMPDLRVSMRCVSGCGAPAVAVYDEDVGPARPAGLSEVWTDPNHSLFVITILRVSAFDIMIFDYRDGKFRLELQSLSKTFPFFKSTKDGRLVAILDDKDREKSHFDIRGSAFIWTGSGFHESGIGDVLP